MPVKKIKTYSRKDKIQFNKNSKNIKKNAISKAYNTRSAKNAINLQSSELTTLKSNITPNESIVAPWAETTFDKLKRSLRERKNGTNKKSNTPPRKSLVTFKNDSCVQQSTSYNSTKTSDNSDVPIRITRAKRNLDNQSPTNKFQKQSPVQKKRVFKRRKNVKKVNETTISDATGNTCSGEGIGDHQLIIERPVKAIPEIRILNISSFHNPDHININLSKKVSENMLSSTFTDKQITHPDISHYFKNILKGVSSTPYKRKVNHTVSLLDVSPIRPEKSAKEKELEALPKKSVSCIERSDIQNNSLIKQKEIITVNSPLLFTSQSDESGKKQKRSHSVIKKTKKRRARVMKSLQMDTLDSFYEFDDYAKISLNSETKEKEPIMRSEISKEKSVLPVNSTRCVSLSSEHVNNSYNKNGPIVLVNKLSDSAIIEYTKLPERQKKKSLRKSKRKTQIQNCNSENVCDKKTPILMLTPINVSKLLKSHKNLLREFNEETNEIEMNVTNPILTVSEQEFDEFEVECCKTNIDTESDVESVNNLTKEIEFLNSICRSYLEDASENDSQSEKNDSSCCVIKDQKPIDIELNSTNQSVYIITSDEEMDSSVISKSIETTSNSKMKNDHNSLEISNNKLSPNKSLNVIEDTENILKNQKTILPSRSSISPADNHKISNTFQKPKSLPLKKDNCGCINSEDTIFLKPGKKWRRSLISLRSPTIQDSNNKKGKKWMAGVMETVKMQKDYGNQFGSRENIDEKLFESFTQRFTEYRPPRLSVRNSIRIIPETENNSDVHLKKDSGIYDLTSYITNKQHVDSVKNQSISYESKASERITQLHNIFDITHSLNELILSSASLPTQKEDREFATAKQFVLQRCNQDEPLSFEAVYSDSALKKCHKIGEGVYGEVFLLKEPNGAATVLKIVPIEGSIVINGEPQKTFDEILSEVIVSQELSALQDNLYNRTSCFVEVKCIRCVQGRYPDRLIELWELFDEDRGAENDHPSIFPEDQLYIVFELAHGGQDLEGFKFLNAEQSYSVFMQTTYALAVAESALKFEHRDLHWGNLLISWTNDREITFNVKGEEFHVQSKGVKAIIIDFTLSRCTYDNCCIYNDLSQDDDLFKSEGDYQFEIYRLMKQKNGNKWEHFEPFTNVLWLHYIILKMIDGARYTRTISKKHKINLDLMKAIEPSILTFESTEMLTKSGILKQS